jgi:hypothetical protein
MPTTAPSALTPSTTTLNLTFYSDPGHGWLRVPHAVLKYFKLKPSAYSYQDREFGYLEEDCDASDFMDVAKAEGYTVNIASVNEPVRDSWIRGLPRF